MKIGIITYAFGSGGVSIFILSLGKYLIELGHSVEIITEQRKGVWFDEIARNGFRGDAINLGIYAWLPAGKLMHSYRVGCLIRERAYDVVLLNNCEYAQLAASMYNHHTPVISVIHNDKKGVYQVSTRNIRQIDAICCVSLAAFKGVNAFLKNDISHCIPNGIELPKQKPCPSVDASGGLKLIFVGRLENEQKGIFLIPEIIKRCREQADFNFHLTIVGEGSDKKQLTERLEAAGVLPLVTFTGNISRKEVYELYLSHHLFLMPSFYEGLPLTLIESMACGCVPVVSRLKDITDFCIQSGKEGFLPEVSDVQGFSEGILSLGRSPELLQSMRKRCIANAESNFSIERMGQDYLNLIHRLRSMRQSNSSRFSLKAFSWKDYFPAKALLLKKLVRK